jgi:hypothetical protein
LDEILVSRGNHAYLKHGLKQHFAQTRALARLVDIKVQHAQRLDPDQLVAVIRDEQRLRPHFDKPKHDAIATGTSRSACFMPAKNHRAPAGAGVLQDVHAMVVSDKFVGRGDWTGQALCLEKSRLEREPSNTMRNRRGKTRPDALPSALMTAFNASTRLQLTDRYKRQTKKS